MGLSDILLTWVSQGFRHPSVRDFFERAITRAREAHAGGPFRPGLVSVAPYECA